MLRSTDIETEFVLSVVRIANPHIDHACTGSDAHDLRFVRHDESLESVRTPTLGPGLTEEHIQDGGSCPVVEFNPLFGVGERHVRDAGETGE